MINGESWLKGGIACDISVIQCKNYTHQSLYQLPIKPSPNLPNMNSVYLYPYLGLFEGTNVSIGRGTGTPFQIVGRPGFEGPLQFKPMPIAGVSDHPKHEGKLCGGYQVKEVLDSSFFENPAVRLNWLIEFYKSNRTEDGPYFKSFIYKLCGTKELKAQIESGLDEEAIYESWQLELDKYKQMREKYLLYP
jgi:uncharacterized protein YbbC (DUF1343 family)